MINLKSEKEIALMKEGGKRLRKVVAELIFFCQEGKTTKEIDEKAEELIKKMGGEPSFKKVKNYFWSTCLSVNEQIVHTPPSERVLKKGDLLTLDVGFYYQGFHTDFSTSFLIGKLEREDDKIERFLKVGKITLQKAISQVKENNRIGDISETIEKEIYKNGYYVIKRLTGHGIGKELHEEPMIAGFLLGKKENTPLIKKGLTIAIEVIYSMGTEEMIYEKDNHWSLVTRDKSLSACFEHTVALTDKGVIILT
ncbi:MAG: type I methionyl aminopeptidase [Patescibacteria group bacterium]|nr:type I methionyl aminopeptidase [Patescibacteria group bacterium]